MSITGFDPDEDGPLAPEVLDKREAEAATIMVREGIENVYEGLARLVKCDGWRAMGYTSFRKWAVGELDYTMGRADTALRKTRALIELSELMGQSVGELAAAVPVRSVARRPSRLSPLEQSLTVSANKFKAVPILTSPSEIAAARRLRGELDRLIPL